MSLVLHPLVVCNLLQNVEATLKATNIKYIIEKDILGHLLHINLFLKRNILSFKIEKYISSHSKILYDISYMPKSTFEIASIPLNGIETKGVLEHLKQWIRFTERYISYLNNEPFVDETEKFHRDFFYQKINIDNHLKNKPLPIIIQERLIIELDNITEVIENNLKNNSEDTNEIKKEAFYLIIADIKYIKDILQHAPIETIIDLYIHILYRFWKWLGPLGQNIGLSIISNAIYDGLKCL
jgi:hypothetical protein